MKQEDTYNRKTKEFFDKIGLEKTAPDFTDIVMSRIRVEPEMANNKIFPGLTFYLLALLFTAGALILPFNDYILDFINNLLIRAGNIDFNFINGFFVSITDLIRGYYISTTVMIIFALSTILFFTMILINYSGYFYRTLRIQMT